MLTAADVQELAELTTEQIQAMSREELLEAVWACEESYKSRRPDTEHDHRRHLDRQELEQVVLLVQQLVRRRGR